ncbi:hypothetical protein [Xenorhabdus sp. IM139775]|uniref:hypothetical protein n=1 Tax=Xenorhabdus sp. IM139775 TaxID=3025876 RepID=UPI0023594F4D|nr:hypothetical protein [Xenorhabdus sp. IM139775]MDC9593732.1 hypothetical protein [Xenorhabdus sp. IM139775]
MAQRLVGVLAKPKKTLRPIGVLLGKLSVPTEEEFAKNEIYFSSLISENIFSVIGSKQSLFAKRVNLVILCITNKSFGGCYERSNQKMG